MSQNFAWRSGFSPKAILKEFDKIRTLGLANTSFLAQEYEYWLPILITALKTANGVDEVEKNGAIRRALNDRTVDLNKQNVFPDHCERHYQQLLARPSIDYRLFASITYHGPKLINWLADEGKRVFWGPSEKSKFMIKANRARADTQERRHRQGVRDPADTLDPIIVHVTARDIHSAYESGIETLDRLRGLLNLFTNRRVGPKHSWYTDGPHAINRFRLGPYQTIHKPDGGLAAEIFWYEPRWVHERASMTSPMGDIGRSQKAIMGWWHKIQHSPFRKEIVSGLVRYCRALDQHDHDACLLGLWQAVEQLAGTCRADYDSTVRRAAKVESNTLIGHQLAQHLRIRRNGNVHAARSPGEDERDMILFQAERLAGEFLLFHIQNKMKFKSHQELVAFLDT
ncbi:hypothetical protein [Aurantimonas sp. A3-2-R12]|uniref:hypothetical protein n=1 Tax=Aurantimonas sp. A3-2-R12 TaxID=3114362 RepID=UPI002E190729|nr:hypothetical protein [Aurantimonas sp. A3-2-R12]